MMPQNRFSPRMKMLLLLIGFPTAVAAVAFAYWTISPLFLNVRVSEALTEQEHTVLREGTFVGADSFHTAEGTAKLIRIRQNTLLVRFEEDFRVRNGPDLHVWLTRDGNVKNGYIELQNDDGNDRLKGNQGSQSYRIPEGTDLSEYTTVIIWCQAFSVLFATARLASL